MFLPILLFLCHIFMTCQKTEGWVWTLPAANWKIIYAMFQKAKENSKNDALGGFIAHSKLVLLNLTN